MHINFQLPTGLLEWIVTVLFMIICVTGISGLLIERAHRRVGAVVENTMPIFRKQCFDQAHEIVLAATQHQGDTQFADFYSEHVEDYFKTVRPWTKTVFGRQRSLAKLLKLIQQHSKTLSEHQHSLDQLRELIHKKSAVEYQHALQSFFSSWLLVHKYTTYALMVFVLLHIILVHVFTG